MKMTKKTKTLIVVIVAALVLVALVVGIVASTGGEKKTTTTTTTGGGTQPNPLAGTYNITMWVSEKEGVSDLFQQQIDKFEAANPGIVINATITGVTEADAGSQVILDVASAPDLYCFAQDQLARLVQASALSAPATAIADLVKAENDRGSVGAGSVGGTLYAYPMTSDNGYYMYYDKSIITNPESLEQIIADVEAYNAAHPDSPKWIRYALENAWYTASFFFAVDENGNQLCHSNWVTDTEGAFTSLDDNFNSANGLIAMKGMRKLAQSSAYNSDADAYADSAVWINGIWNATTAEEHFGDNFAATDLPSYTVDGKSYHLGSFTGNKLLGVKPQTDATRGAVLHLLAQFLTNEQSQMERYEAFQWGPSNLKAQASSDVQANPSLAALALQGNYGIPQGNISGSWWDIGKVLGADAKAATSDADLEAALAVYQAACEAVLNKSDAELRAWSVIGGVNGTMWDTDFPMTEVSTGVWKTDDVLTLNVGDGFKLRQGGGWNVQVGVANEKTGDTDSGYYARLADGADEPGNITVETAGKYYIQLTWEEGTHNCKVEFIPAE